MKNKVYFTQLLSIPLILFLSVNVFALNEKGGISVTFSGTEGTDYVIEHLYYDPLFDDQAIIYLKTDNQISMQNNDSINTDTGGDLTTGEPIRVMFDGDVFHGNANNYYNDPDEYRIDVSGNDPADIEGITWTYSGAFTAAPEAQGGKSKGTGLIDYSSRFPQSEDYYAGLLDSVGDEWHTLTYWNVQDPSGSPSINDGEILYLVVNPTAPAISFSASGTEQYYTSPPKHYYRPYLREQTTYLEQGVEIILTNIMDAAAIEYRLGTSSNWNSYSQPLVADPNTTGLGALTADAVHDFQYRYQNSSNIRTRKIHYEPSKPSDAEQHPVILYTSEAERLAIRDRIIDNPREPYNTAYSNDWNNVKVVANTGIGLTYRTGQRPGNFVCANRSGNGNMGYGHKAADMAFVYAMENGINSVSTYALKAKNLLLSLTYEPLGHYGGGYGNPELFFSIGNGIELRCGFFISYDLLIGEYSGGITAIEDIKIRDNLAKTFVSPLFLNHSPNPDHDEVQTPITVAAVAMPTYDSPVYGHAQGATKYNNEGEPRASQPSWMNAMFTEDPDWTWDFWTYFSDSGLYGIRDYHYYLYSWYGELGTIFIPRHNLDGYSLTQNFDHFGNIPTHHMLMRFPTDGSTCGYESESRETGRILYSKFTHSSFDYEYRPGHTVRGLAKWNRDWLVNQGLSGGSVVRPEGICWYDDSVTAIQPENSHVWKNGFTFYDDIASRNAIFFNSCGQDWNTTHSNNTRDQGTFHLAAFNERFTALPTSKNIPASPEKYNMIRIDSEGIDVGIRVLTQNAFLANYMDYGEIQTELTGAGSVYGSQAQLSRHAFFPDRKYLFLVDKMESFSGTHTYDWRLNVLQEGNTSLTNDSDSATWEKTDSGVRLHAEFISPGLTLSNGSISEAYFEDTEFIQASISGIANKDFVTLLIPLDNGQTTPTVSRMNQSGVYDAARMDEGTNVYYVMSKQGNSSQTLDTIMTTDAEIAVVKIANSQLDYFQIVDGKSMNLDGTDFITSSELINFTLQVTAEGYSFQIEPASASTTSTDLTIGGLAPNVTYTLTDYEISDYYKTETPVAQYTFQSDANGQYSYTQDCSRHKITIQSGSHLNLVINPPEDPENPQTPSSTDTTAPVISNVKAVSISGTEATIIWTTDEDATSQVEYGTDTSYGSISDVDSNLATSHSITISGLSAGTQYHIRAISADNAGNGTVSSDYTFRTAVDDIEAKTYPNPYEYSENEPMTFEFTQIDNGGTIKMYTIAGKLIKTIELPVGDIQIQWDGKDENGFVVASGLYLYVLTTPEGKLKKGKFAFVK